MSEKYPGDDIKVIKGWEAVLARPEMYLGKKSLFGLQCLITGISLADGVKCGPTYDKFFEVSCDDWWEFHKFVQSKLKCIGRFSTFDMVREKEEKDEEAFDLWVKLFKEFKATLALENSNEDDDVEFGS